MKLQYVKHAGFIVESDSGFKFGWDIGSFSDAESVAALGKLDAFTASHKHQDHCFAPNIKLLNPDNILLSQECLSQIEDQSISAKTSIIKAGDTIQLAKDVSVTYFETDHGPNATQPLLENLGFLVAVGDTRIYFPGDIYYPSGIDVSQLQVDYTLLPVGGYYTFGPEEALAYAKSFKDPGTVVPMHFELAPETKQAFLELARDQLKVIDPDQLK